MLKRNSRQKMDWIINNIENGIKVAATYDGKSRSENINNKSHKRNTAGLNRDLQKEYCGIEYIGECSGSHIYMKRDDKLPFSYGGNKVRIAFELMKDIEAGGYDAVISYGSASSNMNRAIADMAKAHNIKCYVIIKTEQAETVEKNKESVTENERLVRAAGAELIYCTDSNVKDCVEEAFARARAEGYKPYYIYGDSTGGGNELSLMRASYNEYEEIKEYELKSGMDFDAIVMTVGTGMTIAGFAAAVNDELAGCYPVIKPAVGKPEGAKPTVKTPELIGISVARASANSLAHIRNDLLTYYSGDESHIMLMPKIIDSYLCGGYGRYNVRIESVILNMESRGIALDPCYTGKSYCGMLNEIRNGSLKGNILFIHTGGYPVYLDWKNRIRN